MLPKNSYQQDQGQPHEKGSLAAGSGPRGDGPSIPDGHCLAESGSDGTLPVQPLRGLSLMLDPCGGMAGDMFLAGLLDLGQECFTTETLVSLAEDLLPGEARLALTRVMRQGLAASHLEMQTPETHHAPHRHLKELCERIDACSLLLEPAKNRSKAVLHALAEAEGQVHNQDKHSIHFHEVGAVDTLIDVCGAALAWQELGIESMFVRPPLLGSGTVQCAHGELPVPPPATAQLLLGFPTRPGGGGGERVTPTGAAVMATWGTFEDPHGIWTTEAVGYGAGTRDPGREVGPANLLRVSLMRPGPSAKGASAAPSKADTVWQVEVNLDDITGQDLGACVAALLEGGALDVWTQAIQMKKQRPGTLLAALVPGASKDRLLGLVLAQTTTFGLRCWPLERLECDRKFESVEVEGHTVRIKLRRRPSANSSNPSGTESAHLASSCSGKGHSDPFPGWEAFPEFEDLVPLASATGWSLWEARQRCLEAFRGKP